MRRAWVELGLVSGVLVGACVDLQPFQCIDDEDCRAGSVQGWCEDARYCSYPDAECPSGRRYSDLAGPLASVCTGVGGSESSSGSSTSMDTSAGSTTAEGSSDSTAESSGSGNPTCGNGVVEPGEECDELDAVDGDGCNTDCWASGSVRWSAVVASDGGGDDRLFGLTQLASGDVVSVGYFQAETRDVLISRWSVGTVEDGQVTPGQESGRVVYDVDGGSDAAEAVVLAALGEVFVCGTANVAGTSRSWVGRWDAALPPDPIFQAPLPAVASGGCFDIAYVSSSNVTAVGGNSTVAWAHRFTSTDATGGDQAEVMGASETRFRSAVRAPDGDLFVAGQVGDLATVYEPVSATDLGPAVVQTANAIQPQSMRVTSDAIVLGGLLRDGGSFDELWVAAFELDGTPRWEYTPAQPGLAADEVEDIALDPAGNVYAIGHVTRNNDNPDRWVAKLDPEGTLVWERHDYEGSDVGIDRGRSIEVLPDGDLLVVAEITSTEGDLDGWIARLAP
ncbi:MAG: hypothetical protein KDK70_29070 [Myxococcales bacterium]|nr:hypothetical protein [Myxococcales bacterium]